MNKFIRLFLFSYLFFNACSPIPQRQEIDFRNNLENAIVNTFPNKVVVIVHPFENTGQKNKNTEYLNVAIPDSIEAMLEPLRSTIAYMPFNGMPFYVSSQISNLFQEIDTIKTNGDTITTNTNEYYFSYLTNYLLSIPTEETQINALTTTNTNYYEIKTNIFFESGVDKTNFISNQILETTTNTIETNVIIVDKKLLTTTNMLLMIEEEFPILTNYLSFLPIEVRRATANDIEAYNDLQLQLTNFNKWKQKHTKSTNENEQGITDPAERFEYNYHLVGSFSAQAGSSILKPTRVKINMKICPVQSTGDAWWEKNYKELPPSITQIMAKLNSLNTNNVEDFLKLKLRTPYKKPTVSKRLQEEFDSVSTNIRDSRPRVPRQAIPPRKTAINLSVQTTEDRVPVELNTWLKVLHATIINRPYTVLRVNTSPQNSLIYLNGFYIGTSPLVYPTAPLGEQRIRIIKDGFSTEELVTTIVPFKTNSIEYTLSSLNNSGVLAVTASIPDAEVFLNSLYKGKTPLILSNLSLGTRYRLEVANPRYITNTNRRSVYKEILLTEAKPKANFDARFKTFETYYRTPAQKALLTATYLSWFTTIGLIGGSVYADARSKEAAGIVSLQNIPAEQRARQIAIRDQFSIASQVTLYLSIASAMVSAGITGWYLHSKGVYLGLDIDEKQTWYAKLKFPFQQKSNKKEKEKTPSLKQSNIQFDYPNNNTNEISIAQ